MPVLPRLYRLALRLLAPRLVALLFVAFPATHSSAADATPGAAPGEILFADPTIYIEAGRYYLTGTRSGQPPGFSLLVSDDLRTWRPLSADAPAFLLRAGDGAFGTSRFWAPQIFKHGADYLLTYTADEHVALAQSRSLAGPYRQETVGPLDRSERNIDSYLFRDDDGRHYLYHVRFAQGNFLWVAEFDLPTAQLKRETLTRCFDRTEPWEATPSYPSVPILEGPAVLKLRGKYYLFYSANHFRSVDYAVGYAVADFPLGPWVKHPRNPILHRALVGENGPGHGDVFAGQEGKLHYVYHVHHSATAVSPRRTRIAPLVLTWNERDARYDIAVDAPNVIKPLASPPATPR